MARILKGAPVTKELTGKTAERAEALKKKGIEPTLQLLRVGEREDDLAYEKGIKTRCEQAQITVREKIFGVRVLEEELIRCLEEAGED